MAWYSHLFENFLQFIVIHTVEGFGIVSKAEIDTKSKFSFRKFSHDICIQWIYENKVIIKNEVSFFFFLFSQPKSMHMPGQVSK